MKKIVFLLAAVALTFVGVAAAGPRGAIVRAHVPFDFTVNSFTLSAGDYTFSELSEETWTIRNDKTDQAISARLVTSFRTNQDPSPDGLVFKHFGSSYFLSEVHWFGGTSEALASKTERSLERQMTQGRSKPHPTDVVVSAR